MMQMNVAMNVPMIMMDMKRKKDEVDDLQSLSH